MCLGVVGQIVQVDGMVALVDFWGVKKRIRLDLVDEPVQPGDYVLNHVGFAIKRIPDEEVAATLAFYEELIQAEDLMAQDVRTDLQAAG
ncbi:MAG: HypC/HybG/HupF family hydrogenase formation chaperone [Chloroflexi bacterium]|nr:HypC/HybG/HupF family hydrogenase formation chaperone [Chloroflexota bacterium]